jgi:hypothetical protein
VKCWGHIGHGRTTTPSGRFSTVSTGTHHTCGLLEGGEVKCWGSNKNWMGKTPLGQATPPPGLRFATH